MASTGIMGDSGEFRTNRHSSGGSGGGGGLIGQAANMFSEASSRKRQLSHEQWMMAGQHAMQSDRLAHEAKQSGAQRIFDATESAAAREHELKKMTLGSRLESRKSAQAHRQAKDMLSTAAPGTRVNYGQGDNQVAAMTRKAPTSPRKPASTPSNKTSAPAARPRPDGSHLPKRYQEKYRSASPTEKRALNQKHFYGKK